ncbi:MAG: propanediol dehydratase, partial [Arachnia propionica]
MDSEQLIKQIMAEVMKNLESNSANLATKPVSTSAPAAPTDPTAAPKRAAGKVGKEHYPLAEKHPELIKTNTGKTLDDLTLA